MSVDVAGVTYYTNSEAAERAAVTRQTLWRWRSEGLIPLGRHYRGKTVLFTEEELDLIIQYAHRVEPIGNSVPGQMSLFNKGVKAAPR